MAVWRALPDELAVEVRHLIVELRRLKDVSGLSLAALAARTPYSKSSWERYLNGAKLPPRQAAEALAGLAGTAPGRALALWDLAEPVWSGRGASGPDAAEPDPDPGPRHPDSKSGPGPELEPEPEPEPETSSESGPQPAPGTGGRQPEVLEAERLPLPHRRAWAIGAAAAVGVALALGAALLFGPDGDGTRDAPASGAGQASQATKGIRAKCHGSSCDGKDATKMGCGGDVWTAAKERVDETYIELRYSNSCRTAWGRIDWGWPGDAVSVTDQEGHTRRNRISYDRDAYTPMIAVPGPGAVHACVNLKSGRHGCTGPGGVTPLPEPPPTPTSATPPRSEK